MHDQIERLRRELWAARKENRREDAAAVLHSLNTALLRQARVQEKDIERLLGPPPRQVTPSYQPDEPSDYYSRRMQTVKGTHN